MVLIKKVKMISGSGIDLRYIQDVFRHKISKTAEIYTHVSKASLTSIKKLLDSVLKGEQI